MEDKIYIAGTGSMYPTFPKGQGDTDIVRAQETVAWPYMKKYPGGINILGFHIGGYDIKRGDIVDFANPKTAEITREQYNQEAGFVKRVIGIPGDSVVIRDGFVYLNGQILKEPYIASPRSTYGGDFLSDCQDLKIPQDKLFVLGDNRKGSLDSRFSLGLISYSDIQHVLPLENQTPYEKNWRSTENDEKDANKPTLNSADFVSLLNSKRQSSNLLPLKLDNLLSLSARKRAEVMLKTDDFSIEASRSGYTLEKSIADSGYHNIVFAETLAHGFYQADELLDNLQQFPETKKLILNQEYQDIGLSSSIGNVHNCPVQVVVVHLAGYKAPNYSKEQIESWQKLVNNLNQVIPSWEKLKGESAVNQDILSKLLSSFYTRRQNAEKILAKLRNNQWFTDEENRLVDSDKELAVEEENFIGKLKK